MQAPQEAPPAETDGEPAAYTVEEFCRAHRIGRATFFAPRAEDVERKKGLGRALTPTERKAPRCKKIGTKFIISREAAREWRNS